MKRPMKSPKKAGKHFSDLWSKEVLSAEEYGELVCRAYVQIAPRLTRKWAEGVLGRKSSQISRDLARLYIAMNPEVNNVQAGG